MTIGERIKARREELGMSQDELAIKIGYESRSSVNKIELGLRNLPQSKIKLIADVLNTTPSYIMGWQKEGEQKAPFPFPAETVPAAIKITGFIPVYGEIPAGVPNFEECQVIDYISSTDPHPENYFALKVKGTSMINAGIPDGAYVTVLKQNTAEDGQIVACRLNGEEATLKRFRRKDDTVILMPENPEFSPIIVGAKDFSEGVAQILGIVKAITIKI